MNAKTWMFQNLQDHIDTLTGEVCCTTLAEDCANSLYNRAAEEKEFDLAVDVAEEYEQGYNK